MDLLDSSSSPESSRRPPRHRRPVLPVVAQWLCGASRSQDPSPPHLRAPARSRPVAASSQPARRTSATAMAPPRRASGEIPLPPPRLFKDPRPLLSPSPSSTSSKASARREESKREALRPRSWPEHRRQAPSVASSLWSTSPPTNTTYRTARTPRCFLTLPLIHLEPYTPSSPEPRTHLRRRR